MCLNMGKGFAVQEGWGRRSLFVKLCFIKNTVLLDMVFYKKNRYDIINDEVNDEKVKRFNFVGFVGCLG